MIDLSQFYSLIEKSDIKYTPLSIQYNELVYARGLVTVNAGEELGLWGGLAPEWAGATPSRTD